MGGKARTCRKYNFRSLYIYIYRILESFINECELETRVCLRIADALETPSHLRHPYLYLLDRLMSIPTLRSTSACRCRFSSTNDRTGNMFSALRPLIPLNVPLRRTMTDRKSTAVDCDLQDMTRSGMVCTARADLGVAATVCFSVYMSLL